MSNILYYSNFCENCKKLVHTLGKSKIKDDIHFICIDNRKQLSDGSWKIILNNGQEVTLPPTVTKVPAVLLLNRGHHVLFGDDIYNHLNPVEEEINNKATSNNGEPTSFSLMSSGYGVMSDNYSFWDQTDESLSAKGDGGLRQMYNYCSINQDDIIETPPDNYNADTIGDVSLEKLQQERNKDLRTN